MIQNKYLKHKDDDKLIEKSYSITFNSALAIPLNADTFNNQYKVTLFNGLGVPSNAKTCSVACVAASVWNYDQNISEPNNKIYFSYEGGGPQTIAISPGYYSIDDLNAQVRLQLNLGGYPTDLFSFSADNATQKVIVNFNAADMYLDFTPLDSIWEILGSDNTYIPTTAPGIPAQIGDVFLMSNVAAFNSVNQFLIECGSICNDGLPTNQIGTSVIAQIGITAAPNSLINYDPSQAIYIDTPHLIGSNRSDIVFSLKNEKLEDVFVIDSYSWTITIKWMV